jgi:hypothetical protein
LQGGSFDARTRDDDCRISGRCRRRDREFRANVVPFTRDQRKGVILLVDRQSGQAVAITLGEDEQAMRASEESANALRADAAGQMGAAQAPAVGRYEVAIFEV